MMTHSDQKPFLCPDCGLAFKQLAQLKNHEVVHKMPDDVSHICTLSCVIITSIGFKMPLWAKVKKCTKCDRFFANSKSLKSHVKTVHEKIRPFICNICGHKSSRKAMLEVSTFFSLISNTLQLSILAAHASTHGLKAAQVRSLPLPDRRSQQFTKAHNATFRGNFPLFQKKG